MKVVYDETDEKPVPVRKFVPEEKDVIRLLPRLRDRQRRL